jgi:hypothetical protein
MLKWVSTSWRLCFGLAHSQAHWWFTYELRIKAVWSIYDSLHISQIVWSITQRSRGSLPFEFGSESRSHLDRNREYIPDHWTTFFHLMFCIIPTFGLVQWSQWTWETIHPIDILTRFFGTIWLPIPRSKPFHSWPWQTFPIWQTKLINYITELTPWSVVILVTSLPQIHRIRACKTIPAWILVMRWFIPCISWKWHCRLAASECYEPKRSASQETKLIQPSVRYVSASIRAVEWLWVSFFLLL